MLNNELTVIFCTCDAYEDLWQNFFMLFKSFIFIIHIKNRYKKQKRIKFAISKNNEFFFK